MWIGLSLDDLLLLGIQVGHREYATSILDLAEGRYA